MSEQPLAIDLFCGLGGWTDGLLAEGYRVVGFDIERHVYGEARYPAQMVLQDVLTIHGSQLKDAALIVASPPCQAYSYRAMPWKRAKALPPPDNTLFEACFRIQHEAMEAANGRHIPLVVENVCGAQKWVGRARWHYGSFYLWGDVPALMPITKRAFSKNNGGGGWFAIGNAKNKHCPDGRAYTRNLTPEGNMKVIAHNTTSGHGQNPDGRLDGVKGSEGYERNHPNALGWKKPNTSSHSNARKAASAQIAKIPLPLSRHIASAWKPDTEVTR